MKIRSTKMALWIVRLEQGGKTRVAEHVAAQNADLAMALGRQEHPGFEVLSVEQVNQVGVRSLAKLIVQATAVLFFLASTAHAQVVTNDRVYNSLRVTTALGPAFDITSTLNSNRWADVHEANPWLRREDGTASPSKLVALHAAYMTVNYVALAKAHSDDYRGWKRVALYSVIGAANAYHIYVGVTNFTLPREVRR